MEAIKETKLRETGIDDCNLPSLGGGAYWVSIRKIPNAKFTCAVCCNEFKISKNKNVSLRKGRIYGNKKAENINETSTKFGNGIFSRAKRIEYDAINQIVYDVKTVCPFCGYKHNLGRLKTKQYITVRSGYVYDPDGGV